MEGKRGGRARNWGGGDGRETDGGTISRECQGEGKKQDRATLGIIARKLERGGACVGTKRMLTGRGAFLDTVQTIREGLW